VTAALATAPHDAPGLFDRPAEVTLDELVVDSWESLASARPAPCAACGEEMTPQHTPASGELLGSCAHCGATLA